MVWRSDMISQGRYNTSDRATLFVQARNLWDKRRNSEWQHVELW
jgi:hypothetical protein